MRGCFTGIIILCVIYSRLYAQAPATTTAVQDSVKDDLKTVEIPGSDSSISDQVKAAVGTLTVITIPDSAFVILDEELKGNAPVTLSDIPAGKHIIIIKKKGYFAKKATVNISAGIDNTVTFELVKPVQLMVSSEPAGAIVQLNNQNAGKTPYTDTKLKPGSYSVRLTMDGYEQQQRSVILAGGAKDSVHVILSPLSKALKDTVAAPDTKAKKEKSKLSSILDKVAIGVFVCFSLVILLIELTQNK